MVLIEFVVQRSDFIRPLFCFIKSADFILLVCTVPISILFSLKSCMILKAMPIAAFNFSFGRKSSFSFVLKMVHMVLLGKVTAKESNFRSVISISLGRCT